MLHLTSASGLSPLADRLAEVLSPPPPDPFTPDWVAVPSAGMNRWLRLHLARRLGAGAGTDGVVANVATPFPAALLRAVVDADQESVAGPGFDPWRLEHLVWSVLEVLHRAGPDPRLGSLTRLPDGATRFGQARRLADLFDRYAVHRPEMLVRWTAGDDVDAQGAPLDPAIGWQPHLWRLVREHIGGPDHLRGWRSLPERLPDLLDDVRHGRLAVPSLPARLAVFGLTTLPGGVGFLDLVDALAATREVHVLFLDPSPGATDRVRAQVAGQLPLGGRRTRADDKTAALVRHPLAASWGHTRREATVLLTEAEGRGFPPVDRLAEPDPPDAPPQTLLARLQADVRADRAPGRDLLPDADDHSVQVHSCHGEARQLEVARDAILHLLAADPTLAEDDIAVLSPDIARFSPLLEAAFGPPAGGAFDSSHGPPPLRWRLTDRSLRASYPLLDAVASLLDLLGGRFAATAVLDFATLGPVRRRYGFDDDDLSRVAEWIQAVNLRWGLDEAHRSRWGLPSGFEANSWRAGLDQLLTGVAVGDDEPTFGPGPVAARGVEGSDVATLGNLADLVARLARLAETAGRPRSARAWVELLAAAADELFAVPKAEAWQRDRLRRLLAEVEDQARTPHGPSEVALSLGDLRRLLSDQLEGAPSRAGYFDGSLTVSSLQPLRWVPHRVVCILGFDEATSGADTSLGDDLIASQPLLGDRDVRADHRQALLEAVLAAGEHLIITRTGHDVRSNQPVPTAVALAELTDALDQTVAPAVRSLVHHRIHTTHGRHPFDEREVLPQDGGATPWTFDPRAVAGAHGRRDRALEVAEPWPEPLAAAPLEAVSLADLHAFLLRPVQTFFTDRLGVRLARREDPTVDDLPIRVSALDAWKLGDDLLAMRRRGLDERRWLAIESARGVLPPGVLGDGELARTQHEVEQLLAVAAEHGELAGATERHLVDVAEVSGVRLVGTVVGCSAGPRPGPARVEYRRDGPKLQLALWLDLMALTVAEPEVPWRALGISRGPKDGTKGSKPPVVTELTVRGEDPVERHETASSALGVVLDLYRRGLREPLPLFVGTSHCLATGTRRAAAESWKRFVSGGEGEDPYHLLAFGPRTFSELLALDTRPGDPPGSAPARAQRFADRLWETVEGSVRRGDPSLEAPR